MVESFENKSLEELYEVLQQAEEIIFQKEVKEYVKKFDLTKEQEQTLHEEVASCKKFYEKAEEMRANHFGYQLNVQKQTPIVKYLKRKEVDRPILNNIGDIYDEDSNMTLNSKKVEREILEMFAKKFGIEDCYWGYITSGGSESNAWGLKEGATRLGNCMTYFCEAAHYSVYKGCDFLEHEVIDQKSVNDESIDVDQLLARVIENYETRGLTANILLTCGTTKYGSVDDVAEIKRRLVEANIPHYIHYDAAYYGGIPNNQLDAPIVKDIKQLGLDSISISLHKYIGLPHVRSVLLSINQDVSGKLIDYIGQKDTTACGSREISPFFTKQMVRETLEYSKPEEYAKNIYKLEAIFKEYGIEYVRCDKSPIFVIDAPNEAICKKYQLSTFTNKAEKYCAHVIVFPFNEESKLRELALEISQAKVLV